MRRTGAGAALLFPFFASAALLFPGRALAACAGGYATVCAAGCNYASISAAVAAIPAGALSGDYCVDVQDNGPYAEQVTVQGKNPNNFRIVIGTTTGPSSPVVHPPTGSTAAFQIANASVTLANLIVAPSNSVTYGVWASSAFVAISSVDVIDPGGNITAAGIAFSSNSVVSYASVTVQGANGFYTDGQLSVVSYSTALANTGGARAALYLNGASSNTFTVFLASNTAGYGVYLTGANNNAISLSTGVSGSVAGLFLQSSSSNSVSQSYFYSAQGNGVFLSASSNNNAISLSTLASSSPGSNSGGLSLNGSYNTIAQDAMVDLSADGVFINSSANNNTITLSTMISASGNGGGYAPLILNGSSNSISQSYLQNLSGQVAILGGPGSYNAISLSTMVCNRGGYAALIVNGGGHDLISQSSLLNPSGDAVELYNGVDHVTIQTSTLTSNAAGYYALHVLYSFGDASNTLVANSYLQGATAVSLAGSTSTVINSSTLVATAPGGSGVFATAGNVNLSLSGNVLLHSGAAGAGGAGVYIDQGNTGAILVSSNTVNPGAQYGVYVGTQIAVASLWITSNTIVGTLGAANNSYGLYLNGVASGATIQNNAIVYRAPGSMGANAAYALYAQSVSGLNVDHNRLSNPGMITGGSYAGAYFNAAQQVLFKFNDMNSTGTSLSNAYLMQLVNSTVTIKDNVFLSSVSVSGSSASITADAVSGFNSDYNDWFSSNSANTLAWGASSYQFPWSGTIGQDAHSMAANPLWSNAAAAAEDFHPLAQAGRYNPATNAFVADGATALTVDAADPAESYSLELLPNGGRANQGSYGGTSQASLSPSTLCPVVREVCKSGCSFGSIQAALSSLPSALSGYACVVLEDAATYNEQVTVQGYNTSASSLTIMLDPALAGGPHPVVNPPAGSTAAFQILNSSVNVFSIDVKPTASVAYGIQVSSSGVAVSSVNVDGGGNIQNAGISLNGNGSSLSYSSVTTQSANAIFLKGTAVNLSYSSATSNGVAAITTAANYHQSTWTAVYVSSGGASFSGDTLYVSYSTFASQGTVLNALAFSGSNSTVTASVIVNNGFGEALGLGGSNNVISQSSITGNASGYPGTFEIYGTRDLIDHDYIRCPPATYRCLALDKDNNVIRYSTITTDSSSAFYIFGNGNTILGNVVAELNSRWFAAFDFEGGHNNTFINNVSSAAGNALFIKGSGIFNNTISQSTFTSTLTDAVYLAQISSNTFTGLSVSAWSSGFNISGCTGTVVGGSTILGSGLGGVYMDNAGSLNLSLSSNTISNSGGAGTGAVYIDANNSGVFNFSTNTLSCASNCGYGLYLATQAAGTSVWVASNTIIPFLSPNNNRYGIYLNGLQTGATIQNNSIALRSPGGASGKTYYGLYGQSIQGVNLDHNRISNPGMVLAGSYVGAYFNAAQQVLFKFNDVNSTGTSLTNAYLMQLVNSTVTIKDNVFLSSASVTGSSASITADAVSGFSSDYNDWLSSNSANTLTWGASSYQFPWSGAIGQDANSMTSNPLWADASAGVEDFHPFSQAGRFSPALQSFVSDCYTSSTTDRGDPAEAFNLELPPNGSRANQGSYGDTAQASKSFQPASPASIGAVALIGQVVLSWTPPNFGSCPSYVDHYELSFSSQSQAGPYASLNPVSSNTLVFLHSGLNSSTTYFYQVVTVDVLGSRSSPAQAFAVTPDTVPPAAVANLAAVTGLGSGQVILSWTFPGDDNGAKTLGSGGQYAIQYTTDSVTVVWSTANAQVTLSTSGVAPGSAQALAVSGLNQSATYYFQLWTSHPGPIWSAPSNTAQAQSRQGAPALAALSPANGFVVARSTTVFLTFNKTIQYGTLLTAFSLTLTRDNLGNSTNVFVAGALAPSWNSSTYTFTPTSTLIGNGTYGVSLATSLLDIQGNSLPVAATSQFTTMLDKTVTSVVSFSTPSVSATVPASALALDGYLTASTSAVSLNIPAANQKLLVNTADPFRIPLAGSIVDLKAYDTLGNPQSVFAQPLLVSFPYADADGDGLVDGTSPPIKASTLGVWWLDDVNAVWVRLPTSSVDAVAKTVRAQTTHFTTFALIGQQATDISSAYAFPVPFKPSLGHTVITFVNVGQDTTIKIYTVSGQLVRQLSGGLTGTVVWDVTNSGGEKVVTGGYLYVVDNGKDHTTGKLVIIR